MQDTFDLKAYLGSKRLLTENFEIEEEQSSNIIRQLKPGQEYTWFMGASPQKCTYVGKDEREPTYTFKLGNSTHKLSIKDVKDYIEPLSTYEEYAAENEVDEEKHATLGKHGIKKRLKTLVKHALTEKKKVKPTLDPEDIDIESAFTKEPDEEDTQDIPSPQPQQTQAAPVNANPVNTSTNPEQKPGFSKEEQEIQNNLKIAYDSAVAIGDQKLATQIGNSLKFFISTHVVNQDVR